VGHLKKHILIIPFLLALLLSSCEKHTLKQNLYLKDKPLNEIKAGIAGSWQLHYIAGGISGDLKYRPKNSFITFIEDDSILWVQNGEIYSNTKISWLRKRDQMGDTTHIMVFKDSWEVPISWGVERIYNDTLKLYDVGYDGFTYHLTRNR
jgi:hypothetical protein